MSRSIRIKYKVKYHPKPIRNISLVVMAFAALLLFISNFLWTPFSNLPIDLQAFAILHVIPEMFLDLNTIAFMMLGIGGIMRLFTWRSGKLELTDDRLVIDGPYPVLIWLRNMLEVDVRDLQHHRWRLRLDSKTDAVEIKFNNEEEFEAFSEKLLSLVGNIENIKLKTTS